MTAAGASLRFLVVDDDDDIRTVLVRMVERLGHRADAAADGVEAVGALAVERYDFMLLDLTMPRMTGEDVLRWLHDHRAWGAGVRAIVVTARAGGDTAGLVALGAYAVLPKPLVASELRRLVDAARLPAAS